MYWPKFVLIWLLYEESKKCPHIKEFGKFVASVNPQFFSMRGYTCGSELRVFCEKQPYCKHSKFIDVKIVDECATMFCPGENDLILSKEAFHDIADTDDTVIEVNWIHGKAHWKYW